MIELILIIALVVLLVRGAINLQLLLIVALVLILIGGLGHGYGGWHGYYY